MLQSVTHLCTHLPQDQDRYALHPKDLRSRILRSTDSRKVVLIAILFNSRMSLLHVAVLKYLSLFLLRSFPFSVQLSVSISHYLCPISLLSSFPLSTAYAFPPLFIVFQIWRVTDNGFTARPVFGSGVLGMVLFFS